MQGRLAALFAKRKSILNRGFAVANFLNICRSIAVICGI